jgi:3-oxoacyl-(acyl-carrier-protein) synthase
MQGAPWSGSDAAEGDGDVVAAEAEGVVQAADDALGQRALLGGDVQADVDIVTIEPRKLPDGQIAVLNNSFGFGGHNICVVFTSV